MGDGVRCGLAAALLLATPVPALPRAAADPLRAEALAGPWILTFTPGGEGVTVKGNGPASFSVQIAERQGRLAGCSVRQDFPAGEVVPARCTLQRGRLVIQLPDDGGSLIFRLAGAAAGISGDASLSVRMLPFSPKIGRAVLTRPR